MYLHMSFQDESEINLPDEVFYELMRRELNFLIDAGTPVEKIAPETVGNLLRARLRRMKRDYNGIHNFREYVLDHYLEDDQGRSAGEKNNDD